MVNRFKLITGLLVITIMGFGVGSILFPVRCNAPASAGPTRIDLSVTTSQRVANNRVVVDYVVSDTGSRMAGVRQRVNTLTHQVAQALSSFSGIHTRTTGRHWQRMQHYDAAHKQSVTTGWRLRQTGEIRGASMSSAPQWIAALEKAGARVTALHMTESAASRKAASSTLTQLAINAFRRRASRVAQAIGGSRYRIVKLHVQSETHRPTPIRMMARQSGDAHPVLHAGTSKVGVQVNGTISVPSPAFKAGG